MSKPAVWLMQCLCPQRHAIMAAACVCEDQADAEGFLADVRNAIDAKVASGGGMNPWCGICGAVKAEWRYECNETGAATIEEIAPVLRMLEAQQALARAVLGKYNPTGTKH